MQRDLSLRGNAFLASTLRALLNRGVWIEQEFMLDRLGGAF